MLEGVVASGLFCARNIDKTADGHVGRAGVAVGQAKNIVSYVKTLDNSIGRGTKAAVDAFKAAAETNKIFDYAYKAVDIASKSVNPLICISSGIDVLTSDDKESALVTNAAALGSMFAVESLMKKHLGSALKDISQIKGVNKVTEKVMNFASKHKHGGKLPEIVQGVAFVVGSCAAYGCGEKFGSMVAKKAFPKDAAEKTTEEKAA